MKCNNYKTKLISVCMPMYNASRYLRECIDSVLAQTFTDFEFIIVDDGSQDDSVAIVKSYNDPRIKLICNKHDYISSLNKGIAEAEGEFIARMDADDLMEPDRLETQYKVMRERTEIDILSGGIYAISEGGIPDGTSICTNEFYSTLSDMARGCCIVHPTVMMRASSIEKYRSGLYSPEFAYAEDFELWTRLLRDGAIFYNMPRKLNAYRYHPAQVSSRKTGEQQAKTELIKKNAVKYQRELVERSFKDAPTLCASEKELTVVIPFLNEREEVANTVRSVRQTAGEEVDIIVINDQSDNDYDYVSDLEGLNVTYVENPYRIGAAMSKEKGVLMAATPYFLLLDAHMRFYDNEWFKYIVSELKQNPDRLLCSRSIALGKNEDGEVFVLGDMLESHGAYIHYNPSSLVPGIKWNNAAKDLPMVHENQIPCVLGAGYASSIAYWRRLKGLKGLIHYGCEEAYISMKAWREGGGCWLLPNLAIGHIYRSAFPYPIYDIQHIVNYLLIAEMLFPTSDRCYARSVAWNLNRESFDEIIRYVDEYRNQIEEFRADFNQWSGHSYSWIKNLSFECERAEGIWKKLPFSEVECVADRLASLRLSNHKYGINDGLTAMLVFLLMYSAISTDGEQYENKIMDIWDYLSDAIHLESSLSPFFSAGYAGIGWGLIFALSHNLIQDDIEEELKVLDRKICQLSPSRTDDFSFKTGLGGIFCYIVARLGYNKRKGLGQAETFHPDFIKELEEMIPNVLQNTDDWRTMNYVLQFQERHKPDWTILPPNFREIVDLPDYIPANEEHWRWTLDGVIGSAINRIL